MKHPWYQLADAVHICASEPEKQAFMVAALNASKPYVVSFVNVHAFNLSKKSKPLRESLYASDVILRDGIGLRLFYGMNGMEPGLNMNGTDLIPEILGSAEKSKHIALYGTASPWLDNAAKLIREMGFNQVDTIDGFQSDDTYLNHATETNPDIIVLAMGMPKQEAISIKLRDALNNQPCLIINGGAILDFLSQRYPRAPMFFQKTGIEWLYRLTREPKRLWRRNFGNFTFLSEALFLKGKRAFVKTDSKKNSP